MGQTIRIALASVLLAAPLAEAASQARPKRPPRSEAPPAMEPRPPAPSRESRRPRLELDIADILDMAQTRIEEAMPQVEIAMAQLEQSMPEIEVVVERAVEQAEQALREVDWDRLQDLDFDLNDSDFDFEFDFDFDFDHDFDFDFDFDHDSDLDNIGHTARNERVLPGSPPEPWAISDPADSIYRLAREALNRGEYRRAAQLFREIRDKFAQSGYAADAFYWESFALYRIGGLEDLRAGLAVLEEQRARFAKAATQADAAVLATRIRGALASLGDSRAASRVERDANGNGACDKEDMTVRIEALSALEQMDPAAATPILRRVLARRDECSAGLRRRAVFLAGKKGNADAATLLSEVVSGDTDSDVRSDAISWLSRIPGEQAVVTLETLLRGNDGERVQRAAVRALAAHSSPRARQIVRAVIENADASERLRSDAITHLGGENATPEDAAYLRSVYSKLESLRLKERTLSAVSRVGGQTNEQWLLALASNANEPIELRGLALSRIARRDVPLAELIRLYDALQERELREHLIGAFGRRKEPEATDKLLEIARSGTDPQLRRAAISALTRKNDPRTTKLLMEILDK